LTVPAMQALVVSELALVLRLVRTITDYLLLEARIQFVACRFNFNEFLFFFKLLNQGLHNSLPNVKAQNDAQWVHFSLVFWSSFENMAS
jgi:hypothetical protein